jgi:hypothetical protein
VARKDNLTEPLFCVHLATAGDVAELRLTGVAPARCDQGLDGPVSIDGEADLGALGRDRPGHNNQLVALGAPLDVGVRDKGCRCPYRGLERSAPSRGPRGVVICLLEELHAAEQMPARPAAARGVAIHDLEKASSSPPDVRPPLE